MWEIYVEMKRFVNMMDTSFSLCVLLCFFFSHPVVTSQRDNLAEDGDDEIVDSSQYDNDNSLQADNDNNRLKIDNCLKENNGNDKDNNDKDIDNDNKDNNDDNKNVIERRRSSTDNAKKGLREEDPVVMRRRKLMMMRRRRRRKGGGGVKV